MYKFKDIESIHMSTPKHDAGQALLSVQNEKSRTEPGALSCKAGNQF